jgi:hypothetical protein
VIIFGSVRFLSKKSNQTEIKKKNKRNWFKPTGFGSVRFFRTKTGSNWFGSVFSVWLGFFPVFFRFDFGFFDFRLIKPKPNRTGQFFQNFNLFFFTVRFFGYCFFDFLGFSVFLLTSKASNLFLYIYSFVA